MKNSVLDITSGYNHIRDIRRVLTDLEFELMYEREAGVVSLYANKILDSLIAIEDLVNGGSKEEVFIPAKDESV